MSPGHWLPATSITFLLIVVRPSLTGAAVGSSTGRPAARPGPRVPPLQRFFERSSRMPPDPTGPTTATSLTEFEVTNGDKRQTIVLEAYLLNSLYDIAARERCRINQLVETIARHDRQLPLSYRLWVYAVGYYRDLAEADQSGQDGGRAATGRGGPALLDEVLSALAAEVNTPVVPNPGVHFRIWYRTVAAARASWRASPAAIERIRQMAGPRHSVPAAVAAGTDARSPLRTAKRRRGRHVNACLPDGFDRAGSVWSTDPPVCASAPAASTPRAIRSGRFRPPRSGSRTRH